MILTVCIISCFILTSFSCLVRTYIKQLSFKSRIIDEEVVLELLEPSPNSVVYDEIDENQLSSDTVALNITAQESHYEPFYLVCQESISITSISEHGDAGYLDPYFAIEEDEIAYYKIEPRKKMVVQLTRPIQTLWIKKIQHITIYINNFRGELARKFTWLRSPCDSS